MNIAVIGCGSLGGVIAARLLKAEEHRVFIIDFDRKIQKAVAENGLVIRTGKKITIQKADVLDNQTQLPGKVDLAIIATRANNLIKTAQSLLPYMKSDAVFITIQNGLAGLDLAHAEGVGMERVIQSAVLWGATMHKDPLCYEITAQGSFVIGSQSPKPLKSLETVQSVLESVFSTIISSNVEGALWAKMHITCALTSLGAITGMRFGKMTRRRNIRNLIIGIGREVMAVSEAKGVKLEPLGEKLNVEFLLDDKGASKWRKHLIIRLIGFHHRKTESSMLADINLGKKTEIDLLNGVIQTYAQEGGIESPLNAMVVELVSQLESDSLQPSPANIRYFKGIDFP